MSASSTRRVAPGVPETAGAGLRPGALPTDAWLLDRAAELVESGWCQRALARDRKGRQVEPWSESARSWSALGALLTAWYDDRAVSRTAFDSAYVALAIATGGRLEEWNAARWRTQHHVLDAFLRARGYLPLARLQIGGRGEPPSVASPG